MFYYRTMPNRFTQICARFCTRICEIECFRHFITKYVPYWDRLPHTAHYVDVEIIQRIVCSTAKCVNSAKCVNKSYAKCVNSAKCVKPTLNVSKVGPLNVSNIPTLNVSNWRVPLNVSKISTLNVSNWQDPQTCENGLKKMLKQQSLDGYHQNLTFYVILYAHAPSFGLGSYFHVLPLRIYFHISQMKKI